MIQDFPEGAPTQKRGVLTYYSANFWRKLHENERIWTKGGTHPDAPRPLDPPLTDVFRFSRKHARIE